MPRFDVTYVYTADDDQVFYGASEVIWSVSITIETPPSGYGRDDYSAALAALLPTGAAWPRDPRATLMELLDALAAELARVDARAVQLVAESDPNTTAELLPEWERMVGLPDPCVTLAQTVAERRAALVGRLTSVGGQSRAFFIQLASRLGYSITIDEFRSQTEADLGGIPYVGTSWAHTWRVNVPTAVSIKEFRAGSGSAGEPLRAWSNEVLECQFNRLKPAHTTLLFAYAAA